MKKSERKDCYYKIAIAMNKGENKKAYEMLRDIASSEGLFILTEYKCADLALLEALERAREDIILYRVDVGLEPEDSDVIEIIDSAIKLAKGDL